MPAIRFENSDELLDAWELAHFLSLFRTLPILGFLG